MATRIYTRTGDDGSTALFGGCRLAKHALRLEAYGTVDELNAHIGVARAAAAEADAGIDAVLSGVQHTLFHVGADLATPQDDSGVHGRSRITRLDAAAALALEAEIDRFEADLPALTQFILPGGSRLAAELHVCRTVCRRAERRCTALAEAEAAAGNAPLNPQLVIYLNRLSDTLFVLARAANRSAGRDDVVWTG